MKNVVFSAVMSTLFAATAYATCPAKFSDSDGNYCDSFNSRPDTARVLITILFQWPRLGTENTPENRLKLRQWTDSVYHTFSLSHFSSPDERLSPPPDSSLEWVIVYMHITKTDALALSEFDFVKGIEYREKPPEVVHVRAKHARLPSGWGPCPAFRCPGAQVLSRKGKGDCTPEFS